MTSAAEEALAGIRVIDVSDGVAGQFAARVLAEHGADVLLVEPPGGCATRNAAGAVDRHLFRHLNTGKRGSTLDRRTAHGRAAFAQLVAGADVLIGEAPEDFDPFVKAQPRLVACVVRDFAPTGPYAAWQGSEMIHQALSGLMHATGRAEREPLYGFGHRAYYGAGAAAVAAIVGALMQVQRGGSGQALEIRVHETAVAMSQNVVAQFSYNGSVMARGPYPGPCDLFECRDGWAAMYCRGDRFAAMCAALGDPELPGDARFSSVDVLLRHWREAYERLAPRVRALPVEAFIAAVEGARGLAARVHTMADVRECRHLEARRFWESVVEGGRERAVLGPLFRLSATPRRVRGGAPELADPLTPRAERRAAPKPARIPSGDRPMYPSDEGLS